MARSRDPKKVALWQGRFRRFVDSGLSVVRFCVAEGVSEASFYYWQKKLGRPRRRRAARAKTGVAPSEGCGTGGELDRVRANGRAARGEVRGFCVNSRSLWANGRDAGENDRGVFRPVTVVPTPCGVVVRLPNGVRIDVAAGQLDALRAVVAEIVQAATGDSTRRADHDRTPQPYRSSASRGDLEMR